MAWHPPLIDSTAPPPARGNTILPWPEAPPSATARGGDLHKHGWEMVGNYTSQLSELRVTAARYPLLNTRALAVRHLEADVNYRQAGRYGYPAQTSRSARSCSETLQACRVPT